MSESSTTGAADRHPTPAPPAPTLPTATPPAAPTRWRRRLTERLPAPGAARLIVLASLVTSIGLGLYISGSAVFFVRSVGLSPTQVGLGLSVAGLAGLALGVPVGHLADRHGPREVTIAMVALQAVLLVTATQVTSFWPFLLVITALGVAESGGDVGRQAVLSGLIGPDQRVAVSAYSRAVFNGGFSLGVLAAGLAIAADTRAAYTALMLGNAATALLACGLYLRLPRLPGTGGRKDAPSGLTALRDLPYQAMAQVSGLIMLGDIVLTVGVPLWVVSHTDAPRPAASWLIGVNTLLVMVFQVRAARGAETLAGATRRHRWAFLSLAASCALTAVTDRLPTWPAVAALAVSVGLLTLGELWGQSARWTVRYDLADPDAQGQYGGAFQLGTTLPRVLGPLLVTGLTDRLAGVGWLVTGSVFALGFLLFPATMRWAERTRSTYTGRT
ncbi:MFS transporter [Kitasatospora sp. NPDC058170]|uniref:MFS transporter n=1 Tax=Kitasatospora sp. NPDC058170 TaxID=3346364 RepID=UPI0036D763FB